MNIQITRPSPLTLIYYLLGLPMFFITGHVWADNIGFSSTASELVVELEWGRGGPVRWDGTISIDQGEILDITDASLMDLRDKYQLEPPQNLTFESETRGSTDGISIRIKAPLDARITFSSSLTGNVQFKLVDIIRKPQMIRIGPDNRHRLWVRRNLRDVVGLIPKREHFIFQPGERWQYHWYLNPVIPFPESSLSYSVSITDDRNGRQVSLPRVYSVDTESDRRIVSDGEIVLPDKEGIYSLWVKFSSAKNIWLPDLRTQFVVLDPSNQSDGPTTPELRLIDSIVPSEKEFKKRFRSDGDSLTTILDGKLIRISGSKGSRPRGKNPDPNESMSWFAYRLNIKNPGRPHLLRLEYPSDIERRFVISILERSERGVSFNGLEQGVAVRPESGQGGVREFVFWPSTAEPAVALVNTLPGSNAALSRMDVYELPQGLPVSPTPPYEGLTLVGPYFEEPHLPRSLGAAEVSDPGKHFGGGTRPDWTTFYDAVTHLAEMIRYQGGNAVMMPVFTYGGSLYPSTLLPNNGRYDDGLHFTDGRHPQQKDIVRLILEIFERNSLTLIPAFVFYSPLPALEKAAPTHDLIHHTGQTSRKVFKLDARHEFGPYYNPLDPVVQNEVRNIIQEFAMRYADSPALGNIALQLNTTSWVVYPGLEWGYDSNTVEMFAREMSIDSAPVYSTHSAKGAHTWLTSDEIKDKWVEWRNHRIRDFYASLNDSIRNTAGRNLILAYMNTFTSRYADDHAVSALRKGTTPRHLLAVKGVDPITLAEIPGVELWRPVRSAVPVLNDSVAWLKNKSVRAEVSRNPQTLALFQHAGATGAVEFNDYFETRVPSLEANWWWPIHYRMVATIRDSDETSLGPTPGERAYFFGGWQIPQ